MWMWIAELFEMKCHNFWTFGWKNIHWAEIHRTIHLKVKVQNCWKLKFTKSKFSFVINQLILFSYFQTLKLLLQCELLLSCEWVGVFSVHTGVQDKTSNYKNSTQTIQRSAFTLNFLQEMHSLVNWYYLSLDNSMCL